MATKKPLYVTDEVVQKAIPGESLRRSTPPTNIDQSTDADREFVPGRAVQVVPGDTGEEPVEMIEGAPATTGPIFKTPNTSGIDEWPIHLTSELTLRPGANGAANQQALRGPRCNWMRIDEIKFECTGLGMTAFGSHMAAVVAASLSLGDKPLTSGFVPISMFGPSRKLAAERVFIPQDGNVNNYNLAELYCWKPAVPIYVPPGGSVDALLQHRGYLLYDARVRVSYVGVVLTSAPSQADRSRLPFAVAWASPAIALLGGTAGVNDMPETVSTEKDLVGPVGANFHVTHLMGRMCFSVQDVGAVLLYEGGFDNPATWGGTNYETMSAALRIKVDSSWGVPLTTDYVTWWALFDRVNRALQVEHVIPPDGYYVARARSEYLLANDAVALPLVSLVGWYDSQEACEVTP